MNKIFFTLSAFLVGTRLSAQPYVPILPTDAAPDIIRKAAHVVPAPRQLRWQELELTAFFHFGINTFTNKEWGDGKEDLSVFNPTKLDARQWVRVARAAGIKQVILTAKHHDGFCLWPSKYTKHTIQYTPYKHGHGDIVKEVADACREYGMGFGIYLSPWDRNSPAYGDSARYNQLFMNWLTELLTHYGKVDEVWFDGANGEGPNGKKQVYAFEAWYHLIRRLQPQAVIAVMGPDVRWVGTESGEGRLTEWSVVPVNAGTQANIAANSQKDETFAPLGNLMNDDLGSRARLMTASGLIWYPAETDVSIRPGWFYHPEEDAKVKTPSRLMDIYFSSVGRNSLLLLNIPPDKDGLISDADIRSLRGWRKELDATFASNLAAGAIIKSPNGRGAQNMLDRNDATHWTTTGGDTTATIDFTLKGVKTFDVLLLQENIRVGQRVEKWVLEYKEGEQWRTVTEGTTIGYKRLLRFAPVTTGAVRLRILSSRLDPTIAEFGLYRTPNTDPVPNPAGIHHFSLSKSDFLLDGQPFQIISGEMHPARIPREYWLQRIRMAKAMGCNTIAVYVFWNYLEPLPGQWDFRTGNHDIAAFIRLCQTEGMWVLLRPGPYVCAEWDWGGLPTWLLKIPDIRVRCMDPRYMSAVRGYIARLSQEIVPLQCDHGGPILMVQVENEYGSYGNDRNYVAALHRLWQQHGVTVPFYTADGPTPFMLEAGSLDSCAIGLDSGGSDADFAQAAQQDPSVPAFSSETYPGWLTHWKEPWQHPDTTDIMNQVRYLLSHHRSFNLYVVHGGTNFGFTAGANAFSPTQFQPDVTSYDYDAPIDEQGRATPKYYALRKLIGAYTDHPLPPVPAPVPVMEIPPVQLVQVASLWENLPEPKHTVTPLPMEAFGQSSGLILYRTKLIGHKSGRLTITEPHDFALVCLNGHLIDTVYRDGGHWTVQLPETGVKEPVLDILVEAMGHINFAQYMIDRKGITDRVTLDGMTLMNWETYNFPLKGRKEDRLKEYPRTEAPRTKAPTPGADRTRPGWFFGGNFELDSVADTYIDLSQFRKGIVWVNGHNLGRYWNVGPQQRLYCPAPWLKKGRNEVRVLDLLQTGPASIRGVTTLE